MTPKQFAKFCNKTQVKLVELDDNGFVFYFETGEYIRLYANIDGLQIVHQGEDVMNEPMTMITQLELLKSPSYIDRLIERYGDGSFLRAENFLGKRIEI
jgi:hypothetical protein